MPGLQRQRQGHQWWNSRWAQSSPCSSSASTPASRQSIYSFSMASSGGMPHFTALRLAGDCAAGAKAGQLGFETRPRKFKSLQCLLDSDTHIRTRECNRHKYSSVSVFCPPAAVLSFPTARLYSAAFPCIYVWKLECVNGNNYLHESWQWGWQNAWIR